MKKLSLALIIMLMASVVLAETIELKNGNVIEGTIIERTDEAIKVDTGLGVDVTYYLDEIKYIGKNEIVMEEEVVLDQEVFHEVEEVVLDQEVFHEVEEVDAPEEIVEEVNVAPQMVASSEDEQLLVVKDSPVQVTEEGSKADLKRKISVVVSVLEFLVGILVIICTWRIYKKAGRPGWASIVPIYNVYVLIKICGRSGWWFFLFIIPVVNIVIIITLCIDLAKRFEKSVLFGLGLLFFPIICYPILAFGANEYSEA